MGNSLKIAIIGYGKMGREIEKFATSNGHKVVCIIDKDDDWEKLSAQAQVAIEFSVPEAAFNNIMRCFEVNLPVVCGTTGWYKNLAQATTRCMENGQTLFYAPNFSLGMNIFFETNRHLASIIGNFEGYKPSITETHHTQKLDAPSGTAIHLANQLIEQHCGFSGWKLRNGEVTDNSVIPIEAFRIEKVPGTHLVIWEGQNDTLEIKHTAHNRSGFAQGALLAAQWVWQKKGVYTMKDLLNL
ncbi:MAG TPA: 4-hydroxy-tetrahydrodipicolinate reductase [Bacteroidales bacterium]|nr:4-hydroxy-tetrahydrodipicolinate reductase [Bacteroidales bacterium]